MVSKTSPVILNNLISVKDAAENSGYSSQYLRRLLRLGKLKGLKLGQLWLIQFDSLNSYLAHALDIDDQRYSPKQ